MSWSPLRPKLYEQLLRRFGGRVKVANKGVAAREGQRLVDAADGSYRLQNYRNAEEGHTWGETYRVCCPYCHETHHRLYIGHLWGHRDASGDDHLHMAYCQNENCIDRYEQRWALSRYVWDMTTAGADDPVVEGRRADPGETGAVEPPGTIWPMDRVPEDDPAYQYLAGRHFDPAWLARYMGVGTIVSPRPKLFYLRDRIYIPVYLEGKLVGWQARYVGDPPTKDIPKYHSCPVMPRRQLLYNLDNARRYPFVVVFEGVMKVWRFGPEAVATFGKVITSYQVASLAANWPVIVLVFDPGVFEDSADLLDALGRRSKVVPLELGVDPDTLPTQALRGEVQAAAAKQGITLF